MVPGKLSAQSTHIAQVPQGRPQEAVSEVGCSRMWECPPPKHRACRLERLHSCYHRAAPAACNPAGAARWNTWSSDALKLDSPVLNDHSFTFFFKLLSGICKMILMNKKHCCDKTKESVDRISTWKIMH